MKGKVWGYSCVFMLWLAAEEVSLLQQRYLLPSRNWFGWLSGRGMKNTSPHSCPRLQGRMMYILLAWNLAQGFVYREWKFPVIKTKFRWFFPESPKAVHTRFEESFQHQMAPIKEDVLSTGCEGDAIQSKTIPPQASSEGDHQTVLCQKKAPLCLFFFFKVFF